MTDEKEKKSFYWKDNKSELSGGPFGSRAEAARDAIEKTWRPNENYVYFFSIYDAEKEGVEFARELEGCN